MINTFPIAATAIIVLSGQAVAADVPQYEVSGFPITPHQASVVGSARVQESLTPTITLNGMPASPHQIAVLTPHRRMTGHLAKRPTERNDVVSSEPARRSHHYRIEGGVSRASPLLP
jgi:hypothetical protein